MKRKITKATFKAFIKKNINNLYSVTFSDFDGMQDCVVSVERKLQKVTSYDFNKEYTWGIPGAWLVGRGDDYFQEIEYKGLKGIECYNCCGSFAVLTK